MFKKSPLYAVLAILIAAAMFLSACGAPAATTAAPVPTQPSGAPEATQPSAGALPIGVILPTKDEPRWIQDEAYFNAAFQKAGITAQDGSKP